MHKYTWHAMGLHIQSKINSVDPRESHKLSQATGKTLDSINAREVDKSLLCVSTPMKMEDNECSHFTNIFLKFWPLFYPAWSWEECMWKSILEASQVMNSPAHITHATKKIYKF